MLTRKTSGKYRKRGFETYDAFGLCKPRQLRLPPERARNFGSINHCIKAGMNERGIFTRFRPAA
jgi:hypothetical protein